MLLLWLLVPCGLFSARPCLRCRCYPFQPTGLLSWYWHGSRHPTKLHPAPPRCDVWLNQCQPQLLPTLAPG